MPRKLVARHINLVGATGELRTGMYDNREHLVVPVVALVEGVIHACNAPEPELVRASVFSVAPQAWNGEPVTWDHPQINGDWVSANSPDVLARYCFGRVFNARVGDRRLHVEAWLDPQRAQTIGQPALDVMRRLEEGELVEVSVGAFVLSQKSTGIYTGGERYGGEWEECYPDHLAMLPAGATGACSGEMGCGAPRVAMRVTEAGWEAVRQRRPIDDESDADLEVSMKHRDYRTNRTGISDENLRNWLRAALVPLETDADYLYVEAIYDDTVIYCVRPEEGAEQTFERDYTVDEGSETVTVGEDRRAMRRRVEYEPEPAMMRAARAAATSPAGWLTQLLATVGVWRPAQGEDGLSDADLREELWKALHAVEPGFDGIVEVFPDTGVVIYTAAPEDRVLWLRRSFSADDEGAVTVNDDSQEVEVHTVYEPVTAAAAEACNCQGECECAGAHVAAAATHGGETPMKLKERIAALISNERSPFTEADEQYLGTLDEERIKALEEHVESVAAAPEETEEPEGDPAPAATDPPPAEPAPATARAAADTVTLPAEEAAEMRAALAERKARRAQRKAALLASLKGRTNGAYSDEDLKSKDVEFLEKLAVACGADMPQEQDFSVRPMAAQGDEDDEVVFKAPDPYRLNAGAKDGGSRAEEVN